MTSANLLIVLIVGTVAGALVGLGLGGHFGNQLYLAILAGFLGTIIGGFARNFIMASRSGGSDEARTPLLVIVYAAIASLAGSSAALEVAQQSHLEDFIGLDRHSGRAVFGDPDGDADDRLSH